MKEILLYKWFVFAHVLSVVLGAGAAFGSDWLFLNSLKNKIISTSEMKSMKILSRLVWIGLILIVLTGVALVHLNPAIVAKASFQAKLTLVCIITINGLVFHAMHMKYMKQRLNKVLFEVSERAKGMSLLASGVISFVSWFFTFAIAMLKFPGYGLRQILSLYCILLLLGFASTFFIFRKMKR